MDKISPIRFTFEKWRGGSLAELGLHTREASITSPEGKAKIRRHAIGYCDGATLAVRPKPGTVAVMFELDDFEQFWTHLSQREFDLVFCERATEIVKAD